VSIVIWLFVGFTDIDLCDM